MTFFGGLPVEVSRPKPQTLNLKPEALTSKPEARNLKHFQEAPAEEPPKATKGFWELPQKLGLGGPEKFRMCHLLGSC